MNHTMSDVTMSHLSSAAKLFVVNENAGGVPVMVDFWNAGAVPHKLDSNMSSLSSTAVGAKNGDQSLMQHPSVSSKEARGDPCKAKVSHDDSQEDQTMLFEKQFVNNADGSSSNSAANLLSAAQPMHEQPQVVDGPYAPIKPKKGQKGLDDFLPDDSEMAEIRAQYEEELLERQRRNDAEAKRLLEVEMQKIAMTSQLEMQNMQAKMMHYEVVAARAHHEFEEQRRAAAEEVQRLTHAATVERQKLSFSDGQ